MTITDPQIITEADIDMRPTYFGLPITDDDLMTREEWLNEFRANICCRRYSPNCSCGGNTHELPSSASRLLADEEDW